MSYRSGQVIKLLSKGSLMQKAPAQMFSSGIVSWTTPEAVLRRVRRVLGSIHLDPCSNPYSTVAARVEYRLPTDGLVESWDFPTIYVNPPFGAGIIDWVRRCKSAHTRHGSDVLMLVPTWTEQPQWHDIIFPTAHAICFVRGRVKYRIRGVVGESPPPMGTALALWSGSEATRARFVEEFSAHPDMKDPSTGAVLVRDGDAWTTKIPCSCMSTKKGRK